MTTHRGVPISLCDTCHREHPQGKRHCDNCGRPSAFINDNGHCLDAECRTDGQEVLADPTACQCGPGAHHPSCPHRGRPAWKH